MKRKTPSAIFQEWDRICDVMASDGHRTRYASVPWQALWDTHMSESALASTHIDDADLICSLGWQIAMQDGDFSAAAERISRWFEHPNIDQCDPISHTEFLCRLAEAWFYAGDTRPPFELFRFLLGSIPKRYVSMVRTRVATALFIYCGDERSGVIAPIEIAELATDVFRSYPEFKRMADGLAVDDCAFAELYTGIGCLFRDATGRRYRPHRWYPAVYEIEGREETS